MASQQGSFFTQHPWMTFFLGMAVVSGVVTAVRGYDPAYAQLFKSTGSPRR